MSKNMQDFFESVGKTNLLTREEEVELSKLIEMGDQKARDKMIRANIRLAISIAKNYANKGVDLEDLIQESSLGLIKAVDRFDWRKGFKFSTYACWWIKQAVRQHVAAQSGAIKLPSYARGTLWKMKEVAEEYQKEFGVEPTHQEIADLLESYQSGNIFTLADNVSNPDVANILSASLYAGLGPNDVSPLGNPETLMAMYPNLTEAQARAIAELSINPLPFKGGGLAGGRNDEVMLETSLGTTSVPSGGIAQVPTEFTQGSRQPDVERDIQALEAAVLGRVNKVLGEQITNMFVQKYGPDVYRVARESILRRSTPNAQTEGMISGQGSGMDDMVQGMIGDEQPVAVSPGEFIVPADVVSGLGEGSSDAGAKKLDEMMDRVRMERNGTTKQAPQIDERKMMPA